jgi:hypothetical protein
LLLRGERRFLGASVIAVAFVIANAMPLPLIRERCCGGWLPAREARRVKCSGQIFPADACRVMREAPMVPGPTLWVCRATPQLM